LIGLAGTGLATQSGTGGNNMDKWRWMTGALALGLLLVLVGTAEAERVPMTRTQGQKSTGARIDISVPYTTNGRTAFGVYSGVSPRIYSSPIVDDPKNPQVKPVYNLPFWGAYMSFGDKSNGAAPKPASR
jgi:hypothetical protein